MSKKLASLVDLLQGSPSASVKTQNIPSLTSFSNQAVPAPSPRIPRPISPLPRVQNITSSTIATPPSPVIPKPFTSSSVSSDDSSSEGEANYDIDDQPRQKIPDVVVRQKGPLTPVPVTPKVEFNASAVLTQKASTPVRVMALNDKSNMMTTYADMLSTNSIENQLESHKYTILDRVITNENGVKVNYVKAYDPNGVIVFIMMDSMGNMAVRPDEIKALAPVESSSIRVSDKNAAISCAGTGICGVALVCKDEICIMIRNNDGSIHEASYRGNSTTMTSNNSSTSFVIIKMSEIMADPEGTINRSFEANERMVKSVFQSAQESLNRTLEKADLLQKAIKSFHSNRESAYQYIVKDKNYLSPFTRKYYSKFSSGTLNAEDESKYVSASANLYARNKIFNELITLTNAFSEEEEKIEKICNVIIEINNKIVKNHEVTAKKILTSEEINRL
jgi:hypothetical protein